MKKLYTLLGTTFLFISGFSQVETVVSGLEGPWGLALDGTTLYIAERNGGKISQLDLTAPELGTTDFLTGIINPSDITLGDGKLYIGEREGTDILEVDLSSPSPEVVTTADNYITGLELVGDDLYYCRNLGDSVYIADVSGGIPTSNTGFVGGLDGPYGIAVYGTDMYIADDNAGKVMKVDMTASTPVTEDFKTYTAPNGLLVDGDFLYVADYSASAGAIYQINLVTDNVELLALSLSGPLAFAVYNGGLYFSEFTGDKISKLSIGLGVDDLENENASVYPNPSSNEVYIIGMDEGAAYTIYSLTGEVVSVGTISQEGQIDIQHLSKGTYSIHFEGTKSVQFVKE